MSEQQPMNGAPRIPVPGKDRGGKWVDFGDEAYRVPALGLLAIQELGADIESLQMVGRIPNLEQMRTVVRIVHAALRRNYPQLTEEDVGDMLDIGNFQDVLGTVFAISGFVKGAASGEMAAT